MTADRRAALVEKPQQTGVKPFKIETADHCTLDMAYPPTGTHHTLQNIGQDTKLTEETTRRAALVERVARVLADGQGEHQEGVWRLYAKDATAAIDLIRAEALEEAARVADAIENKLTEQWKAGYKVCDYTQGASDGANDCAAAIRALKGKT